MKKIKVKITLTEEMLGMSASPEIHEEFIASKAPDAVSLEEEVKALGVGEVVAKGKTVFPRENGVPFMWDYQIKGAFKDFCGGLRRAEGTKSSKITAYKKIIDTLIFPQPRKILFNIPDGGDIGSCQRPLRADTAQGPRIALADSETVPAGTTFEFSVVLLEPKKKKNYPTLKELIIEWLEYGELRGLGQWRNSGKGKFEFEIIE